MNWDGLSGMRRDGSGIWVPQWSSTIAANPLLPPELHIWCACLTPLEPELKRLLPSLSGDEQDRISRLRFPLHRQRSIASRGILRSILGHYLDCAPCQIQFRYTATGKPRLDPCCHSLPLEFNVSHSQDLGLFAFAVGHPVGIDVEAHRSLTSPEGLVQRFFAEPEQATIAAAPNPTRSFFQYWTSKEALTKATGQGIAALTATEICVNGATAQVIAAPSSDFPPADWQIQLFTPEPGYEAAIAYPGSKRSLKFFVWQSGEDCEGTSKSEFI